MTAIGCLSQMTSSSASASSVLPSSWRSSSASSLLFDVAPSCFGWPTSGPSGGKPSLSLTTPTPFQSRLHTTFLCQLHPLTQQILHPTLRIFPEGMKRMMELLHPPTKWSRPSSVLWSCKKEVLWSQNEARGSTTPLQFHPAWSTVAWTAYEGFELLLFEQKF